MIPVTVRLAIEASKNPATAQGAIILFRGEDGNAWTPYGVDESTAKVIVGKTTHFSPWSAAVAAETYCYLNQCGGFSRLDPNATAEEKSKSAGLLPGSTAESRTRGPTREWSAWASRPTRARRTTATASAAPAR